MQEIWKAVPDYEGFYEVSNLGRVRSLDRMGYAKGGFKTQPFIGKILKQITDKKNRMCVGLYIHGTGKRFRVHRLVMLAFVGICPDGNEVCHNDGDPSNNHITNLRYDTRKSNHADKIKHGTNQIGCRNGNSKLTDSQVFEIKTFNFTGKSAKSVSRIYNVSESLIFAIWKNEIWKHVK